MRRAGRAAVGRVSEGDESPEFRLTVGHAARSYGIRAVDVLPPLPGDAMAGRLSSA